MKKLFPEIKVFQEACPMWVPLIENGELDSEGARYFIKRNINQLLNQSEEIDTLLLGCTHYPVLYDIIREYMPSHIQILPQGHIVASSLDDYLHRHPEMNEKCRTNGLTTYLTTGSSKDFDKRASSFMNQKVSSERIENLKSVVLESKIY